MAAENTLFQTKMSDKDIIGTIAENAVIMLGERKWIPEQSVGKEIERCRKDVLNAMKFSINISNGQSQKCHVMILRKKISSSQKTYGINEFISDNKNVHKIIVVRDINNKIMLSLVNNTTEIFMEDMLMINMVDHVLVPKHEILEGVNVEDFLKEFRCTKKNMPKIFSCDPIARYYNMKPGQICRITRPSEGSGESIFYRYVIKKSVM